MITVTEGNDPRVTSISPQLGMDCKMIVILVDMIRTLLPCSADAFTDPLRIERIGTYGPSVASAESVFVFVNEA